MQEALGYFIVGIMLMAMSVANSALRHLPCSTAMIYLVLGFLLGPKMIGLLQFDLERDASLLRSAIEIALLVSLFAIGLRLRVPLSDRLWMMPCRLGLLAMLITIPLLALCAMFVLGLNWGPALLLAAILAPTDPVLAHDVQVRNPGDRDVVRFALSGEGGLNDGIALPFVLVGLALCCSPSTPLLPLAFVAHMLWGIAGAAIIGGILGWATMKMVGWLRTKHAQALGLEGFFALALIILSFGAAQLAQTFGFIAVFAAGVAMRHVEHCASGERPPHEVIGAIDSSNLGLTKRHPKKAHAYMAESVLSFTIELEHLAEAIVMMIIGSILTASLLTWQSAALALTLFFVVRPTAVFLCLAGSRVTPAQRRLMAWFGIRGIGSFYYLVFTLEHSAINVAHPLISPVLVVITISVIVHGMSATPLMNWYHRL